MFAGMALANVSACGQDERAPEESVRELAILDNGSFDEARPLEKDERGILRIPWWRSPRGVEQLEADAGAVRSERDHGGR
jgi:hypothetical protein